MPIFSPLPPTAYFTEERNEILPDFNINKVIVTTKTVRVLCSLKRDPSLNYDAWLGSSEFLKYVNFYFIIAGNMSTEAMGNYYYPKTRIQSLSNDNTLNWEITTKPHPANNYPIWGGIKVSLNEIISGKYFSSSKRTPSPPLSPNGVLNSYSGELNESDDIYFEVEIEAKNLWISDDSSWFEYQVNGEVLNSANYGRNLLAFCQLDVKALSDTYNLDQFVGNLRSYGGSLKFENLLIGKQKMGRVNWKIPETISAFFDESGNPYSGMAHYRTKDNPAIINSSDDRIKYVGWMSGLDDLEQNYLYKRKLLTKREVKNTKIVSKIFLEGALDPNGNPINYFKNSGTDQTIQGPDTRYVGYPAAANNPSLATTQNKTISDYGNLNLGDDLVKTLRAELGLASLAQGSKLVSASDQGDILNTLHGKKMRMLAILGQKNQASNFFTGYCQEHENSNWLELGTGLSDSYYGSIFNINYENMVKSNSKFGQFIDFHRNTPTAGESNQDPGVVSREFIKECLRESRIYNISIYRRRVTNSPESNNKMGTASFTSYDKDQIEEKIFSSSYFTQGRGMGQILENLGKAKTALEIVRDDINDSQGNRKIMIFRDYDLFKNVNHGTYQYSIEFSIVDGIEKILKKIHESFAKEIDSFTRYYREASRPYIPYFSASRYYGSSTRPNQSPTEKYLGGNTALPNNLDLQEGNNGGNYDFVRGEFSEGFKARSGDYKVTVMNLVYMYMRVLYLMTKKSGLFNSANGKLEMYDELIDMLLPQKGDIGNMEFFLDLCLRLESAFKNKIYSNESSIIKTMNLGTFKRNPSSNKGYSSNLMCVKGNLKNTITVASKNSVFFRISDSQRSVNAVSNLGSGRSRSGATPQVEYVTLTSTAQVRSIPSAFDSAGPPGSRRDADGAIVGASTVSQRVTPIVADSEAALSLSVAAAAYGSTASETYDSETSKEHDDPVRGFNNLLSSYGGTTLDHLLTLSLTRAKSECQDLLNENSEISDDVQKAIFDGIVQAEDRDTFVDTVENTYKEHYFKKAALGGIFDFVTTVLTNKKDIDSTTTEVTYKEKVKKGITTKEQKNKKNNKNKSLASNTTRVDFSLYEMDTSGAFRDKNSIPAGKGTGIYMIQPADTTNGLGVSMTHTNNVFVSTSRNEYQNTSSYTNSESQSSQSQKEKEGSSSSTDSVTQSESESQSSGGTTSGY